MRSGGILAAIAFALVQAAGAIAQPAPAERWQQELEQTSQRLAAGHFAEARTDLLKLTRVMADTITTPSTAHSLFALALVQLAIADAGLGDVENAIWHWHIAQNIHESARTFDLSRYGNATAVLRANKLPPAPEKCAQPANAPAPAIVKRSEPRYPQGVRQAPITGLVIVEIELDAEGRPKRPQVLRSPSAALTYSTLMTLREWRFAAPAEESSRAARFCRIFSFQRTNR